MAKRGKKIHGMYGTRFYFRYYNIVERCTNAKATGYARYGGRGIKCEWKSFSEFKNDMLDSYTLHVAKHGEKNTSIERIDNDGNYSKENCKWATPDIQARNKRSTRIYTVNGETLCIRDWERKMGYKRSMIQNRLARGWDIERAIFEKQT